MTGGSLRATSSTKVRGQLSAATRTAPPAASSEASFAYGTGPARIDTEIIRTRTLAAGASETIDLWTGTTLLDLFDHPAPLRSVKYLEILVTAGGDASGLRVGGAASNCWAGYFGDTSDKLTIFPDGPPFQAGSPAGVAVAASACNLKLENLSAVGVTYQIVIGGSAALGGAAMGVLGLTYP